MDQQQSRKLMEAYEAALRREEKSEVTVEKYLRDARTFLDWADERPLTKELVQAYKRRLIEHGYATRSVNAILAGVNSCLRFLSRDDCRVRGLRSQQKVYCSEARELTREEYLRLLGAAKNRPRLHLLLQTIGRTGIRISELRFFTVEAARRGEVEVSAKGKRRVVLLPARLKKKLLDYARRYGIQNGALFRTRSGRPLDRSNIWTEMKSLCTAAKVAPGKVFPHNLRKLFARSFYALEKDIAKLADVLGHSSVNTTRIYIMTSGNEHRRLLERMHLVT